MKGASKLDWREVAPDRIKLTFQGSYPTLNGVIAELKKHWSCYSNEKRKYTQRAHWEARSQYNGPAIERDCGLYFEWFVKNKKIDPDNITIGAKYIIDGMVNAGVLKDDNLEVIEHGIFHFFTVDAENPRCEVTIISGAL